MSTLVTTFRSLQLKSALSCLCLSCTLFISAAQLNYVDSLEQQAYLQKDVNQKIETLNELIRELLRVSPDRAMQYATLLNKIADSIKSDVGRAHYFRLMASLSSIQGNYLTSTGFIYRAITLYEQLQDPVGVANSYIALANNYTRQKLFRSAISNQKKALKIFENLNRQNRIGVCLTNLASLYNNLSIYDSARIIGERSVSINGGIKNYPVLANDYKNLGFTWYYQNEYDSARKYFEKALTTSNRRGTNTEAEVEAMIGLGKLNYKTGNKRISYDYLERAINRANEYGVLMWRRDALIELSKNYAQEGDYHRAHYYLSEHLATIDSLIQNQQIERAQLGDIYLNALQESHQYNLLKTEKELKEKIIQQQRVGIILGIVSIVVLSILVYYLKRINSNRMQINAMLNEQKEEIARKNFELEKVNQTKDKFFSIVAHDLRSPLNSLKSFANLVHLHVNQLTQTEISDLSKQLESAVDNTVKMTDNLITWARMQMKSEILQPEWLRLEDVIKNVFEACEETAELKNISLVKEVPSALEVYTDKNSIAFIVRNLVNNAIKFTMPGGNVKVIAAAVENNHVKISVIDNGVGMDHATAQKIFDISSKSTKSGTSGEKGTGLGLILCMEFALRNNAKIWVESEPEKGSTFHVLLLQGKVTQ